MGAAAPIIGQVVFAYAASKFVTKFTGNEKLGMVAGLAAAYWTGGMSAAATETSTATTSAEAAPVVAGGGAAGGTSEGIATVGAGSEGAASLPAPFGTETASQPGLLENAGSWIEKNPMAASMGFNAVLGAGSEYMRAGQEEEARKAALADQRILDEERYKREHTPMTSTSIPGLSAMNEGLIDGGYKPLGQQVKEGRSSDLPNYQQLLEQYKGNRQ